MSIDETKLKGDLQFPNNVCGLRRLDKTPVPNFWGLVEQISCLTGFRSNVFDVQEVSFFFGKVEQLATALRFVDEEAQNRFKQNIDFHNSWESKFHYRDEHKWVVTSDGTVFVKGRQDLIFYTAFPLKKRRQQDKQKWAYVPMVKLGNGPGFEHFKPEWSELHEFVLAVERLTIEKWKEERQAFMKAAKASGIIDQRKKERKARQIAERTKRKMKTVMQARTVIQELEQYIKDVEDGTATQKQVGGLYDTMMSLISLNKHVKTLFPKE